MFPKLLLSAVLGVALISQTARAQTPTDNRDLVIEVRCRDGHNRDEVIWGRRIGGRKRQIVTYQESRPIHIRLQWASVAGSFGAPSDMDLIREEDKVQLELSVLILRNQALYTAKACQGSKMDRDRFQATLAENRRALGIK